MSIESTVRFIAGDVRDDEIEALDALESWSRWTLLDLLGNVVAGSATPRAAVAVEISRENPGDIAVAATGATASASWAAFATGVACHALDWEDGHYRSGGVHAGSSVLPALLTGLPTSTTLTTLRRALLVGYEVTLRAGALLAPEHSGREYRTSGAAGALGATAALLRARAATTPGVSPGRTTNIRAALALAEAYAPHAGLVSRAAKESVGWAAATAVTVDSLARHGFVGASASDESVFTPGLFEREGTPEDWSLELRANECYAKPYASCRVGHAAIDAVLQLTSDVDPRDIAFIETTTPFDGFAAHEPASLEEAQFSIPFVVGVAAAHGEKALAPLVSHRHPSALSAALDRATSVRPGRLTPHRSGAYPGTVSVTFTDGRVRSATVRTPRGDVQNPLNEHERRLKAQRALSPTLGEDATRAVIALSLGEIPNADSTAADGTNPTLGTLLDLLRPPHPSVQ